MKQFEEELKKLGLTKTEASIYLTSLGYEAVSVAELVKLTALKRPTIYHALETLETKGLAGKKKESGGHLRFVMSPPEAVKKLVTQQIENLNLQHEVLDQLIPLLAQHKNRKKEEKFSVSHYQGLKGIKMVIDIALYCKSHHWDIIAPENNFFSHLNYDYIQYYLDTRRRWDVTSRSLWEKNPQRRILTAQEIRLRQPRFMPKTMHGKLKSVLIIFDDKVAIISSYENLSAILITSQEIKDMFSIIFETIWSVAEPYFTKN